MTQKASAAAMLLILLSAVMIANGEPEAIVSSGGKCKPDGSMYANIDYCTKFFVCYHGTLRGFDCIKGTVWNQKYHTCVRAGSEQDKCTPQHPQRECERRTVDFIPDLTRCQLYYDCFNKPPQVPRDIYQPYQRECMYPYMFDIRLRKCVGYTNAICGEGRKKPTWECEYVYINCQGPECAPCPYSYPSCIGKPDGIQPTSDNTNWDMAYVICNANRSASGKLWCDELTLTKTWMYFNPIDKICVSKWEVPRKHGGLEPTCDGERPGIYTVKETPNVAYSCPSRKLFWCDPPFFKQHDLSNCTHFGRI